VVVLGVGNELTEGRTQDVHARYLGGFFRELGMEVRRVSLIPDDYALYVAELRRGAGEAEVVVTTGGLGPTSDDLTREAIAEVSGHDLVYHGDLWDRLKARFPHRRISETNKKQVMIPRDFHIFENAHGTAPGFAGLSGQTWFVALPGPPRELLPMVEEQLRPLLAQTFEVVPVGLLSGTALMVPESNLEEALQRHQERDIHWGTRAEMFRISFAIRGGNEGVRERVFERLREELGAGRIHRGDTSAAELLLGAAEAQGKRIVTAESCTGGLMSKLLTDIPGSSTAFWGGVVAYSNQVKQQLLGVSRESLESHGAVSAEVAEAMATGALDVAGRGADVAISVTGIAGPDGGTAEKPVGTVWCAVASREGGCESRHMQLPASRDRVRRWSALSAMLMAHEILKRSSSL
jgi:nicotinamide-nucleotide amidase